MSSYIFKASKCIMIDTVGKPIVESRRRITSYSLCVQGNDLPVIMYLPTLVGSGQSDQCTLKSDQYNSYIYSASSAI